MLFTSLEVFLRYFLVFLFKVDVGLYFATFWGNILLFVDTFFLKMIVCNVTSTMMPLPDPDPSEHVLSARSALNNIIYFSYILVFAKPPQPSPSVILRLKLENTYSALSVLRPQRCRPPPSTVKPERVARFIKAD